MIDIPLCYQPAMPSVYYATNLLSDTYSNPNPNPNFITLDVEITHIKTPTLTLTLTQILLPRTKR